MNTLGHLFRLTSFGESHGPYVGCVIDGCPAGLVLDMQAIQQQVDRRRSNTFFSTPRREADIVQIISGVYEGKTTGSPITILIPNQDTKPEDYKLIEKVFRPGHADYTYQQKYGWRDHRGGGRSSVRITAPWVAAGEIARQWMRQYHTIDCRACVTGIGGVELPNRYDYSTYQWPVCDDNHWRTPDAGLAAQYDQIAEEAMQKGDTVGGLISVVVNGVPVGWGEPVFSKLSAELGKAMLGINSVKGFEMGYGFEAARQKGSTFNDALHMKDGQLQSPHNKSGGVLGGISTGEALHFHVAFKPISSIRMPQQTINADGQAVTLQIEGRHDVCAVPRAIPIVEALTLLVLADACLHHQLNKHD